MIAGLNYKRDSLDETRPIGKKRPWQILALPRGHSDIHFFSTAAKATNDHPLLQIDFALISLDCRERFIIIVSGENNKNLCVCFFFLISFISTWIYSKTKFHCIIWYLTCLLQSDYYLPPRSVWPRTTESFKKQVNARWKIGSAMLIVSAMTVLIAVLSIAGLALWMGGKRIQLPIDMDIPSD